MSSDNGVLVAVDCALFNRGGRGGRVRLCRHHRRRRAMHSGVRNWLTSGCCAGPAMFQRHFALGARLPGFIAPAHGEKGAHVVPCRLLLESLVVRSFAEMTAEVGSAAYTKAATYGRTLCVIVHFGFNNGSSCCMLRIEERVCVTWQAQFSGN